MCLFKRELFVTLSTEQKSKILDILSQHHIKFYVRTKDNFDSGIYSERRTAGSFGMDMSCRFIYHIFVAKKDYANAKFLLNQNQVY